uniref:Translation initiation factor IF-1 n=1 Tax=Drosera erythrorhiza TaxID=2005751 RepID=A0A1Z1GBG5_9CARY|nr:translation initiation factor 1 [Drosera erythrorhiza]ARV87586.1 translation initiation factor 1 [Drosera erythrorhiza]
MADEKIIHEGLITEELSNGMYRVDLGNQNLVLGYLSGKIRRNFILVLPGHRVKIEISSYDSTKGRIIYRIDNKKSKKKEESNKKNLNTKKSKNKKLNNEMK